MKRSSVLSRAFFRRPAVRDLVPDLKLVLVAMTVGCESHVGVWRPGGLAEDCGLDPASLAGALADLEKRGHVVADTKTGECFLTAIFRDNSFSSPQRVRQARDDFRQIESPAMRQNVMEAVSKNPGCGLQKSDLEENHVVTSQGEGEGKGKGEAAADTLSAHAAQSAAASLPQGKRRRGEEVVKHGVEMWTAADAAGLTKLVSQHGAERVEEVAAGLKPAPGHQAPFLSAVFAVFQALAAAEAHRVAQETRQSKEKPPANPESAAKGLARVKAVLRGGGAGA